VFSRGAAVNGGPARRPSTGTCSHPPRAGASSARGGLGGGWLAPFVAAWRHIVNVFRREGADNVSWLWTVPAGQAGTTLTAWWPGARYVTWVGVDGSYSRPADAFATVFGRAIHQTRRFTTRPILLSVTVARPASDQAAAIDDLFTEMHRYQTLGLMWSGQHQSRGAHSSQVMSYGTSAAFHLGTVDLNLVRP
jgi:hypothetical protein